jgi:hypothetical protein
MFREGKPISKGENNMSNTVKSTNISETLRSAMTEQPMEESTMTFQLEGDYAQGLRTLQVEFEGSDYARGLRTQSSRLDSADYARGLRTLPAEAGGPDYARGLRSTVDSGGTVTGRNQRKGLTSAGAPAAGK